MGKNDLSELSKLLETYTEDITEAIEKEAIKLGGKARTILRAKSPVRTGEYSKGWGYTTNKGRGYIDVRVWNKKHYRLTHLLEWGHATRNGGHTRPQPHILPVEREINKEFEANIERIIGELS